MQTVAIALAPRSAPEGAAELQLDTTTAFSLSLGPLKLTVDGIGATVALGTTKGEVPENAARLMGKLLYIGDVGFLPPKGIGIVVDGKVVTGGGYLFYDRDNNQYAGVAAALARQALDADRDRADDRRRGGLLAARDRLARVRPRVPAVPRDPAQRDRRCWSASTARWTPRRSAPACATRRSTRSCSRPTWSPTRRATSPRSRPSSRRRRRAHLLGFTVSLGFGAKQVVRAELGVVYEFGAGSLGAGGPAARRLSRPPPPKKLLELHVDALGHLGSRPERVLARRDALRLAHRARRASRATWRCACARATRRSSCSRPAATTRSSTSRRASRSSRG